MSSFMRTCSLLPHTRRCIVTISKRNLAATSVLAKAQAQSVDPIQKLFLDKLQEYKTKNKRGKLIAEDKTLEAKFNDEVEQLKKRFGGGNIEEFPTFSFEDQPINPATITDYDVVDSLKKHREEKIAQLEADDE